MMCFRLIFNSGFNKSFQQYSKKQYTENYCTVRQYSTVQFPVISCIYGKTKHAYYAFFSIKHSKSRVYEKNLKISELINFLNTSK